MATAIFTCIRALVVLVFPAETSLTNEWSTSTSHDVSFSLNCSVNQWHFNNWFNLSCYINRSSLIHCCHVSRRWQLASVRSYRYCLAIRTRTVPNTEAQFAVFSLSLSGLLNRSPKPLVSFLQLIIFIYSYILQYIAPGVTFNCSVC